MKSCLWVPTSKPQHKTSYVMRAKTLCIP